MLLIPSSSSVFLVTIITVILRNRRLYHASSNHEQFRKSRDFTTLRLRNILRQITSTQQERQENSAREDLPISGPQ
jgi:hypothetical protein